MISAAQSTIRRKRLGQYFTGARVARVLAAVADASSAETIVDPMAGSGDMLAACLEIGATPECVAAIEIDPDVARLSEERLRSYNESARVVAGDAFDGGSWAGTPDAWDLVITNPPYVRYQAGNLSLGDLGVRNANQIRSALLERIEAASSLNERERIAFRACADEYSGHSDLAVPAWLLCAIRVKRGGRLAVVVPDRWLSRNYAAPILYVLRRFFELEFAVRDADGSWFPDALVRTTLLVARRVDDKLSPMRPGGHLQISLPADVASETSLVAHAFPHRVQPEVALGEWAKQCRGSGGGSAGSIEATWSDEIDLKTALQQSAFLDRQIQNQPLPASTGTPTIPERLQKCLGIQPLGLVSLDDLGWKVGQGLRTGANDFFYVSLSSNGHVNSALTGTEDLQVPSGAVRPAVRRQSDLHSGGNPVLRHARWGVLLLDQWALPEDIREVEGPTPWRRMDDDLARLVRLAAETTYTRRGRSITLPQLSAVRTNGRKFDSADSDKPTRFWYQLPQLTERHTPVLYVPRVNHGHPGVYFNPQRELIVDANFATLWPLAPVSLDPRAMLALLSSTWATCFLELTAPILGGGALKVEAAHLKRLRVPRLDAAAHRQLVRLAEGLRVDHHERVRKEIDRIVTEAVYPGAGVTAVRAVEGLAHELRRERV